MGSSCGVFLIDTPPPTGYNPSGIRKMWYITSPLFKSAPTVLDALRGFFFALTIQHEKAPHGDGLTLRGFSYSHTKHNNKFAFYLKKLQAAGHLRTRRPEI